MKCYIYIIQNNITNEKYVGQTTNFSRRIQEHYSKLRENQHPNPKLQSSWNKYGEENFSYTKEKFDITKEELDQKEIETIKKENSFENGFNLTEGGTGGNTRGKLTFERFVLLVRVSMLLSISLLKVLHQFCQAFLEKSNHYNLNSYLHSRN